MAMEKSKKIDMDFNFAAEVYTNISAANIFISFKSNEEVMSSIKVKLHKDFLIVSVSEENDTIHQLKINAPNDYFIPLSFYSVCHNFSLMDEAETGLIVANYVNGNLNEPVKTGSMSFSFRIQVNGSLFDLENSKSTKNVYFREPESEVSYMLYCRQCKGVLRDNAISYKKVAPVLNNNASEVSEAFFCHRYDNYPSAAAPQEEDDLLFTYNYYRMSFVENNNHLTCEAGSRNVFCSNCHAVLGTKKSNADDNVLLCFKDKIVFHAVDRDMSNWPSSADTSLSLLLDIIEKTMASSMTCKLVLEVKITPSSAKCLLLWVISQNMKLFKVHQSMPDLELEENLALEPVMKVLFHEARPNSETTRSWMRQFTVDHYFTSDSMMQEVVKILSNSAAGIPACPDMTPSFSVGYLPIRI